METSSLCCPLNTPGGSFNIIPATDRRAASAVALDDESYTGKAVMTSVLEVVKSQTLELVAKAEAKASREDDDDDSDGDDSDGDDDGDDGAPVPPPPSASNAHAGGACRRLPTPCNPTCAVLWYHVLPPV